MYKHTIIAFLAAFLMGLPLLSFGMTCSAYVEQQADIHLNGNGDISKTLEYEHRHSMATTIFDDIEVKYGLDMVGAAMCLAVGVQKSTCKLHPSSYLCMSNKQSSPETVIARN